MINQCMTHTRENVRYLKWHRYLRSVTEARQKTTKTKCFSRDICRDICRDKIFDRSLVEGRENLKLLYNPFE